GVGMNAGGWTPSQAELDLVQRNHIEVALICCFEHNQAAWAIPNLRNQGVKSFILRAGISGIKGNVPSANDFADRTIPILHEYVNAIGNAQPIMIAVHNEPNKEDEGWTHAWLNGAEFAQWFLAVTAKYRQEFPGAKIGFPAVSPGGAIPGV